VPRSTQSKRDLVSVAEFYRLVPDGQKADLIDGVIYMASPDSIRSNDLTAFVTVLLRSYNAARKMGGRVYVTRVAFRLAPRRAPEPDVAYVRPERIHLVGANDVKGAPDIAVEIVSRESQSRDYGQKKRIYQKAGVTEYWIIDPLKVRYVFLRLEGGKYQPVALENGRIFRSQVLGGFWLDVDWLRADPLPNDFECLQAILRERAGPRAPRHS
jgi:Uma2 family endonuclease